MYYPFFGRDSLISLPLQKATYLRRLLLNNYLEAHQGDNYANP